MSELYEKATARPWRANAMGGSSTVLAGTKPKRNDTRIPAYAYREEHCIAYPFIEGGAPGDMKGVRLDFVCFSHDDAALIVHAVNNIEALEHSLSSAKMEIAALREALAKASGWFEDYAKEHYAKAKTAPDGREQHGREVKGKTNAERAAFLRAALGDQS